jgi:hypothetical protein
MRYRSLVPPAVLILLITDNASAFVPHLIEA